MTLDDLLSDDFLSTQSSHTVSQEAGPLKKYDETVRSGKLKLDRYQRQIVEHLQRLHDDVVNYQPTSSGFFSKVGNMVLLLKNFEPTGNLYCSQLEEIFPVHKSWSKSISTVIFSIISILSYLDIMMVILFYFVW